MSQISRHWDEAAGQKQTVDYTDKARYIERNDQLFVGRLVDV